MCGYGEAPSVQWVEHPVARKEHKCCECLSVISPGERYERVSGVWDGEFGVFKTCMVCAEVREAAMARYRFDDSIPFECLWEIVGVEFEDAV